MADAPASFSYSAPTQVWYAEGGLARLGSYLKRLGVSRGLVVCDPLVAEHGLAARVADAAGGRIAHTWSLVEADAPRESVLEGADQAVRLGVDGIIAVGGGSSIDSGKAIALLAKHGGDVVRWDGVNHVGGPGRPLVAIPTTAGTGSEVTDIAVVKDTRERALSTRKLVIIDRAVYPSVAILDPTLTVGLPPGLTAATGLDALTHAVEGIVSTFRQPTCDAIGLECVRIIRQWLPRAVREGRDLEARGWMLMAASMAGQLVALTFSGVCHSVAHALGVGWGVHHGTANALALPWTIRYNAGHPPSAAMYARAGAGWGLPRPSDDRRGALAFADAVEELVAGLDLGTRLASVGVREADLARLAELAFRDPSHSTNPVPVTDAASLARSLSSLL